MKSACKPGSVKSNHSSRTPVTKGLKRPTRKRARIDAALSLAANGCFPIWPCSTWGLPSRRVLPPTRCALTAPFHPYRPQPVTGPRLRRFTLCCTFRGLTPPRRYLARYSREPGLSSPSQPMECGDCPADFADHHTDLRFAEQTTGLSPAQAPRASAWPVRRHPNAARRQAAPRWRPLCPAATRAPAAPVRGASGPGPGRRPPAAPPAQSA